MKICIISNLYSPYIIGGAEIYVESIAKKLSEKHTVILITTQPYKNYASLRYSLVTKDKLKIYSFYPFNIYHSYDSKNKSPLLRLIWHGLDIWNLHSYLMLGKILQRENPDVVHTHNLNGFSLSAIEIIKKIRLPLVHTCHDFSLICPYATLSCFFRKNVFCDYPIFPCHIYRKVKKNIIDSKPDIVIFPSRFTLEVYLKNNLFRESEREILYYCVEANNQRFLKETRDDYFNLLYVGQLVRHKGVHILIDAFKSLTQEKIKLHIVGGGDYEDNLKNLAGDDKRIVFYGRVKNTEVDEFYQMADIVIVPSLWPEVLGIVILESLSLAVPVIGSNIGGIREIVKDGYNGFIFEPGDQQGLIKILKNILLNPNLLPPLKNNARESSLEFGISEHILKLEEIYKKAINLSD